MTKQVADGEMINVIETIRTDKKAAVIDVGLFQDIIRRHAWIEEGE